MNLSFGKKVLWFSIINYFVFSFLSLLFIFFVFLCLFRSDLLSCGFARALIDVLFFFSVFVFVLFCVLSMSSLRSQIYAKRIEMCRTQIAREKMKMFWHICVDDDSLVTVMVRFVLLLNSNKCATPFFCFASVISFFIFIFLFFFLSFSLSTHYAAGAEVVFVVYCDNWLAGCLVGDVLKFFSQNGAIFCVAIAAKDVTVYFARSLVSCLTFMHTSRRLSIRRHSQSMTKRNNAKILLERLMRTRSHGIRDNGLNTKFKIQTNSAQCKWDCGDFGSSLVAPCRRLVLRMCVFHSLQVQSNVN